MKKCVEDPAENIIHLNSIPPAEILKRYNEDPIFRKAVEHHVGRLTRVERSLHSAHSAGGYTQKCSQDSRISGERWSEHNAKNKGIKCCSAFSTGFAAHDPHMGDETCGYQFSRKPQKSKEGDDIIDLDWEYKLKLGQEALKEEQKKTMSMKLKNTTEKMTQYQTERKSILLQVVRFPPKIASPTSIGEDGSIGTCICQSDLEVRTSELVQICEQRIQILLYSLTDMLPAITLCMSLLELGKEGKLSDILVQVRTIPIEKSTIDMILKNFNLFFNSNTKLHSMFIDREYPTLNPNTVIQKSAFSKVAEDISGVVDRISTFMIIYPDIIAAGSMQCAETWFDFYFYFLWNDIRAVEKKWESSLKSSEDSIKEETKRLKSLKKKSKRLKDKTLELEQAVKEQEEATKLEIRASLEMKTARYKMMIDKCNAEKQRLINCRFKPDPKGGTFIEYLSLQQKEKEIQEGTEHNLSEDDDELRHEVQDFKGLEDNPVEEPIITFSQIDGIIPIFPIFKIWIEEQDKSETHSIMWHLWQEVLADWSEVTASLKSLRKLGKKSVSTQKIYLKIANFVIPKNK